MKYLFNIAFNSLQWNPLNLYPIFIFTMMNFFFVSIDVCF